jgi:hypothetical protein
MPASRKGARSGIHAKQAVFNRRPALDDFGASMTPIRREGTLFATGA